MTLPRTGSDFIGHIYQNHRDISIHAPRTGSDPARLRHCTPSTDISTHAPRTGSDFARMQKPPRCLHFNPRSPHGERHDGHAGHAVFFPFQSTLPARGATLTDAHKVILRGQFQSTLPARGATDVQALLRAFLCISIHAPRTGSDCAACVAGNEPGNFNPRSPHGERRKSYSAFNAYQRISIHAPRTGSDETFAGADRLSNQFQSTLPARGATTSFFPTLATIWNFNPRSPHGERPCIAPSPSTPSKFQSTLPARGATHRDAFRPSHVCSFQSTLPARGATQCRV